MTGSWVAYGERVPRSDRWDCLAERYAPDSAGGVGGQLAHAVLDLLHLEPGIADCGCLVTGVDTSAALLAIAREDEKTQPRGIEYPEADATDRGLLEAGPAGRRWVLSDELRQYRSVELSPPPSAVAKSRSVLYGPSKGRSCGDNVRGDCETRIAKVLRALTQR